MYSTSHLEEEDRGRGKSTCKLAKHFAADGRKSFLEELGRGFNGKCVDFPPDHPDPLGEKNESRRFIGLRPTLKDLVGCRTVEKFFEGFYASLPGFRG